MNKFDTEYKRERIRQRDLEEMAYKYIQECEGKSRMELSREWEFHSTAGIRYERLAENEMRRPGRENMRQWYKLNNVMERHQTLAEIARYFWRQTQDPKIYFGNNKRNFRHSEAFWFATCYANRIGDKEFIPSFEGNK